MFSGIIEAQVIVKELVFQKNFAKLSIKIPKSILNSLKIGGSLAINGVCLSVVKKESEFAVFDVVEETLQKTNLGLLEKGHLVNIERPLKLGDEVGGHILSGHVFQSISFLKKKGELYLFNITKEIEPYLFIKGYVAINGASLTIADKNKEYFAIALIPQTLKSTNLGSLKIKDKVNLEINSQTQAIVDTIIHISKNKNKE